MLISGCSIGGDKTAESEKSGGSGASTVSSQTPEEIMSNYQGKLYTLTMGNSQVLITEDGREIMKGIGFKLIEDEANKGKYKYIAVMDFRDGQVMSRLLDGQLKEVLPAAPMRYLEIFEDAAYVSMHSEVVVEGEEYLPSYRYLKGDYNVIGLSDGKPISVENLSKIFGRENLSIGTVFDKKYISVVDETYNTVGWIDFDGNAVDNIPTENFYPLYDNTYVSESKKDYTAEGFYAATEKTNSDEEKTPKQFLYDKNFKDPLGVKYDRINYCPGYVLAANYDGASVVYSLPDLKEVYRVEDSAKEGYITYYNGKILIQEIGVPYSGNSTCQMKTVEGQPLGETYSTIWGNDGNNSGTLFSATDSNNAQYLLNNKGEVILSLPENGHTSGQVGDNLAVNLYSRTNGMAESCEIINSVTGETVEFENSGKYRTISPLYAAYSEPIMWQGVIGDYLLVDILDKDGKFVLGGLRNVQLLDMEKGYIQARRGFEQGMMTLKGEWIYKVSIFGDEDEGDMDYMFF